MKEKFCNHHNNTNKRNAINKQKDDFFLSPHTQIKEKYTEKERRK